MKSLKRVWLNLILAPFWFLIAISGLSVYYSVKGLDTGEISLEIADQTSVILLIVQIILLLVLVITAKKEQFSLFASFKISSPKLNVEIIKGVIVGSLFAVLYLFILSPIQYELQKNVGDIIPPGEAMKVLGGQIIPFFIANVVLAPFVEESLYRNYALTKFEQRYSSMKSVLLSALAFGFLHWTGGIWYILMTGIIIGIPFGIIASRKKNILLIFVAHLTLNFIEFIYIAWF
ncbi:hypothetical protein ATZ33_09010 [Enterococcus silesiacus]|uniref:CAAX protease self-immunity n=1 Tax=Enterococcus silesiacus TaxID=332949 RepID=A0A0S3KB05_9ENTE|nr:type II CAAX endopeptidase family protein [Enterococcus silesiacus]ALS01501.1 hypothetical protein ATZ33_09010 [Enterococcus silesiacus]OJG91929.1 CAAX protease self-immunity [Enterococcus silesiacus]